MKPADLSRQDEVKLVESRLRIAVYRGVAYLHTKDVELWLTKCEAANADAHVQTTLRMVREQIEANGHV